MRGSAQKVQCIVQSGRYNVNITNNKGYTPLHVAVAAQNSLAVVILLKHPECSTNIKDHFGMTPLNKAAVEDARNCVEVLILSGKCSKEDIKEGIEKHFILHQAVASGSDDFVRTLLTYPECDINGFNSKGVTPLHVAFGQDILSNTARILVNDKRCDLNIHNNSGDIYSLASCCMRREKWYSKGTSVTTEWQM